MKIDHVEEFKNCLGLNEFERKKAAKARKRNNKKEKKKAAAQLVTTLASKQKQNQELQAEVVKFSSHKSKKKQPVETEKEEDDKSEQIFLSLDTEKLEIDEIRHQVFKFGLSGLSAAEREAANVALAIKLGAQPPKNKCIPLQELHEKRKQEKEEKRLKMEEDRNKWIRKPKINKNLKSLANPNKGTQRGDGPKLVDIGTKIGKFDGGILKISKHELKKLKGSKGKKK